jgi:hypothetical protein
MKCIGLGLTLKLEINKMTHEEKLAFAKEHLWKEVEFSDNQFRDIDCVELGGIHNSGRFMDHNGVQWFHCRPIPKKKLIPWNLETAEGVPLRHKERRTKVWMNYGAAGAWYNGVNFVSEFNYEQLLEHFETVDGRPCGTEVME